MRKALGSGFFERPTLVVARDLLGKFLVRRYRGREIAVMIAEVEAYDGFHDKGSHASRGETKRNAPMFGAPGCWYVYFTYGMHWMLNVVTRERGYPAAILIRAVCPIGNNPSLNSRELRDGLVLENKEFSGPARLTKKLYIDKKLNGLSATKESGLWIEDRGVHINPRHIKRGPRIGIAYAGPYWSKRRWRFWLD